MIPKASRPFNVRMLQRLQFSFISDHKHTLLCVIVVTVLDNGV